MKIKDLKLKDFYISRNGNFKRGNHTYYYAESCAECGEPYLSRTDPSRTDPIDQCCTYKCANMGKRNPMFGRNERKPDHSLRMMGNLNPNYIDGRSCNRNQYCTQWSDKEYKHWIVHDRDDGKCFGPQCNGKHIHKLMPHHINYIKKDCRPVNLITLCVSCNSKANYDREWHEIYYTTLMIKRGLK